MMDDGILDGDIVIVRKQVTANEGDIVVALVDGEATVKRFFKEKTRIRLQPSHPTMRPIYVDSTQDAHIQGQSLVSLMAGAGQGRGLIFSITDPWMPNPQFASRSQSHKRIEGADSQVFDLLADPNENSPLQDTSILNDSKSTYLKQLEPYRQRQHKSPQQPALSKEECARLEALGYTTCDTNQQK